MSDPVKNVEIEDVLSSIRRLLADGEGQGEGRPATAPQPVEAGPRAVVAPSRVRPERRGDAPLVLTPALRVAGRPEKPAEPAPLREAQAGPAAADDDFEAPDLPDAPGATLRSRLKETIAELEAAITHQADDWEPDGSEAAPVMDWHGTRPEDTPFLSRRHAGQAEPERPAPGAPSFAAEAGPGAATGTDDRLTENSAFDAPRADTLPEQPDQAMAAPPAPDPQADTRETDDASDMQASEPPRTEIDEEMLRRLIVEVLREELRGPLGDRITGNLRKLVRREIFRALASGEFD
ncbi:hypothetical protein [Limimaricola hongkongensis]|uniref:Uncharacterized protein n=1 Tax=Limimaricola hongkongensis DSM 17492 TaxID=1122180 RepID=A0A017HAL9_9RHOB|nr:hypothetical protein [Limimaricola hongkongensis]EYD71188.1 hypothetical protein Lokhon_02836 [Limimaricola hongkongensis DSM 17492]